MLEVEDYSDRRATPLPPAPFTLQTDGSAQFANLFIAERN